MGMRPVLQGGRQAVSGDAAGACAGSPVVQVQPPELRRVLRAARSTSCALHGARPVDQPGTAQYPARSGVARSDRRIVPTGVGAAAQETATGIAERRKTSGEESKSRQQD